MPDYGDDKGFQGSGSGEASTGVGDKDAADRSREQFNRNRQITDTNPYGNEGFFTRVFGIDPKNISYAGNFSTNPSQDLAIRKGIAANQLDKFVNPMRDLGQRPGTVRPGLKAGDETAFGTVESQYTEQTPQQMAARFGAGLLGGPLFSGILSQVGTTENVIAGLSPGFDPQNPRGPQGILGQAASLLTGGLDPTQATARAAAGIQSLRDRFAPDTPMPGVMPTSPPDRPARNPDSLAGFEQRFNRPSAGAGAPRSQVNMTRTRGPGVESFFAESTEQNPVPSVSINSPSTAFKEDLMDAYLDSRERQMTPTAELRQRNDQRFGNRLSSSTIGFPDVNRRRASTVDTTNLYDQGGGMYRTTPKQSAYEKVLEMMGIRQGRRGPAAQIFVPKDERSIFDSINFGGMFK